MPSVKGLCENKCIHLLKLSDLKQIASNLSIHDIRTYWKGIKQVNNTRLPNPNNVGGAENVRNIWLHRYESLLNSIPDSPVRKLRIHKIDMYCSNIQLNDNIACC